MIKEKHIHKLKKRKYPNGTEVYFCLLNCNYKIEAEFAIGKEALCHICGDVFTMNENTIRLLRPHCSNCGRRKIKTSDGKFRYVRTRKGSEILTASAMGDVEDLKERLDNLVSVDEDI